MEMKLNQRKGFAVRDFATANKFQYLFFSFTFKHFQYFCSLPYGSATSCQFGGSYTKNICTVGILVDYWESINKLNLLLCLTISFT